MDPSLVVETATFGLTGADTSVESDSNAGAVPVAAEPNDEASKQIEIFNREIARALELRNSSPVNRSDQKQNQQVCVNENALA